MRRSRLQAVLDGALVIWVALWIWAGITVGHGVAKLAELGDTAGQLGNAVTSVGRSLGDIPVIGGDVSRVVESAGRDATASAHEARDDTRRAGLLLGIAIALVPTLPLLLAYVPRRVREERERNALRAAVSYGDPAAVDELLAMRAVAHLPVRTLQRVSADPAADLRAGRHAALADAELERLEIRRPRR